MNNNNIKIGTNKSFGIVFFLFFLIVSLFPLFKNENIRVWSLIIAIIFLILGLLNSKIGHTPRNLKQIVEVSPQKWMKFWENKIGEKLPKVKKDRKNKLKEIASDYTSEKVTLWNADAILITMYGMYTEQGEKQ